MDKRGDRDVGEVEFVVKRIMPRLRSLSLAMREVLVEPFCLIVHIRILFMICL